MIEFHNATVFYFSNKTKTVESYWFSRHDLEHLNKYKRFTLDGQIVKLVNLYIEPRDPEYTLYSVKDRQKRNYLIKQGLSNYTKPFSTFDFDKMYEENPEYFI